MERKNLVLAVVFSLAFLFLWSVVVVPRFAPPPLPTPPASTTDTAAEVAKMPAQIAPSQQRLARPVADHFLRDERNDITWTSMGGAIKNWRLKLKGQEIDLVNHPTGSVESIDPSKGTLQLKTPDRHSLLLTVGDDAHIFKNNVEIRLEDVRVDETVRVESERVLETFPKVPFSIRQEPNRVVLEGTIQPGLKLVKTLTLNPAGFLDDLTFRFENSTSQPLQISDWSFGWGPGLGTTEYELKENAAQTRALSLGPMKTHKLKPGDYPIGRWAGIDNRYFLVAAIPSANEVAQVHVTGEKADADVTIREPLTIPPHGQLTRQYGLYVGPKGFTQLKGYDKGLEAAVDFGFFSILGKYLLRGIYQLQRWTGNYGWAIVAVTLLLQLLILPLTLKSYKSMQVMRQIQPQMKAIQEQFKSDPKRQQIEVLNLYKKTGANPVSGCLPMFLQIPIFYAFFTMLRNAYELRGAPWVIWIKDLSAADPLHILPVSAGLLMYLSQRFSGVASDPTQRQMMIMTPIMMTFFFWSAPSGLSLYLVTSTLWSCVTQLMLARQAQTDSDAGAVRVIKR